MIKISKQQAHKRFKTLPQNIKDSIFSEEDADLIQTIGEQNHLSQEKISGLALILSHIFLGFVYHEDLQKELEETLHLNHQASIALSQIVKDRLITPYKSDLEKIYRPLSEEDFGLAPDRRTEERNSTPRPVLMKETPKPVILSKEGVAPKLNMPTPVPKPGAPIPKPETKMPLPGAPKPSRPRVLSPFSFQKEARPLNTPSEFKLGGIPRPSMTSTPSAPTPPRPARVELGREEIKKAPIPESKVVGREPVRYTEPKSTFVPAGRENIQAPTPPPFAPKKPEVPLPSYPRPISKDKLNAIPNPTIH